MKSKPARFFYVIGLFVVGAAIAAGSKVCADAGGIESTFKAGGGFALAILFCIFGVLLMSGGRGNGSVIKRTVEDWSRDAYRSNTDLTADSEPVEGVPVGGR